MQRNSNIKYCNKTVFKKQNCCNKKKTKKLQTCPFQFSKVPTDNGNSFSSVRRGSECRLSF